MRAGVFSPSKLVFKPDSTWSFAQVIRVLVTKNAGKLWLKLDGIWLAMASFIVL
jgi:hypothetical protein